MTYLVFRELLHRGSMTEDHISLTSVDKSSIGSVKNVVMGDMELVVIF